ncbi:maestro heat-like repeat-containing protein family member 2B [Mauremys reevesii]|uniref:maestro heat-like repeat-containing protein family member 2B n=1 Tax=Mauremys reevesii TaxID=260615 RepID=UPI00193F7A91|nr:maestro heat-like repeat-containing protein family member 2B [Mauremys reevesii]
MENFRLTSTAFLAQLMSDPMLREKKLLKIVLSILEERSQDRNSIVHQMAVRGLGNIVDGAPVKVKKHKKFLLDILIKALNDTSSSEVIGESMKALAKVLKELKEKDIGSSFKDLTQQIQTYFDNEDDALRSMAFVLFGILAQLTKKKWKAYFAEQVRKSWVTLLLHLQDPSPKVSMVRPTVTYLLSQRNLPPNARGALLFLPVMEAQILPSVHCPPAESVPARLVHENAELLENLYRTTITYFSNSWEEIRAVAANLAGER